MGRRSSIGNSLPVHDAIKQGKDEMLILSIIDEHLDSVMKTDQLGNLLLHCAVEHNAGHNVLQKLLTLNPDAVNEKNNDQQLPIHVAARCGHHYVKVLLEAKVDSIHISDAKGRLLLHYASKSGWETELLQHVLELNIAACRVIDDEGYLPIHYALLNRSPISVVKKLFEVYPECAKVAMKDRSVMLHHVFKDPNMHELTHEVWKVDPLAIEISNADGFLPLHMAAKYDADQDTLRELVRLYPDGLSKRSNDGKLAVDFARDNGAAVEVVDLLSPSNMQPPGSENNHTEPEASGSSTNVVDGMKVPNSKFSVSDESGSRVDDSYILSQRRRSLGGLMVVSEETEGPADKKIDHPSDSDVKMDRESVVLNSSSTRSRKNSVVSRLLSNISIRRRASDPIPLRNNEFLCSDTPDLNEEMTDMFDASISIKPSRRGSLTKFFSGLPSWHVISKTHKNINDSRDCTSDKELHNNVKGQGDLFEDAQKASTEAKDSRLQWENELEMWQTMSTSLNIDLARSEMNSELNDPSNVDCAERCLVKEKCSMVPHVHRALKKASRAAKEHQELQKKTQMATIPKSNQSQRTRS